MLFEWLGVLSSTEDSRTLFKTGFMHHTADFASLAETASACQKAWEIILTFSSQNPIALYPWSNALISSEIVLRIDISRHNTTKPPRLFSRRALLCLKTWVNRMSTDMEHHYCGNDGWKTSLRYISGYRRLCRWEKHDKWVAFSIVPERYVIFHWKIYPVVWKRRT